METSHLRKQRPLQSSLSPAIITLKSRRTVKHHPGHERPLQRLNQETPGQKLTANRLLRRPAGEGKGQTGRKPVRAQPRNHEAALLESYGLDYCDGERQVQKETGGKEKRTRTVLQDLRLPLRHRRTQKASRARRHQENDPQYSLSGRWTCRLKRKRLNDTPSRILILIYLSMHIQLISFHAYSIDSFLILKIHHF